jgi:hypothetical protein
VVEELALKGLCIDPGASEDENLLAGRITLVPVPPVLYGHEASQLL